ncbi:hypothetical protein SDRG_05262 [Saprolegnia diclina VS20]|uniref:DUF4246 domain-containing protein n=1 Tax=Saprolegnia diclina (strain VS20) TaxID=1156394 RepID=T0RWX3_SAPDV|nr:hypothetical protein SDRG_05262 [Saprolegnia diclina VS20]EQC37033.1 hypothetical protein SDRG_05262 [Saprolegnia diclina VS20]|eukprot:XP_008609195.1 hypothetical protein SDRG_05262 [Saprolegnia diclina VS20]
MDDAIAQALEAGHQVDVEPAIVGARDRDRNTALHLAAKAGHVGNLATLLELPWPSLDVANQQGLTPLHIAATRGHAPLVSLLLDHGADIDFATNSQQTALFMAVAHARVDVVELLLRFDANPNAPNKNGETPLFALVKRGPREENELIWSLLLLSGTANVDHRNKEGRSLLSTAIHTGNRHERMVSLVLSMQPSAPVVSEALWYATPYPNLLELLLAAGADPNSLNDYRSTPLHDAIRGQLLASAHMLIPVTNLNVFDVMGQSPLTLAVDMHVYDVDFVRGLLQHGADPRLAADDSVYSTPLYIAINAESAAIVALLAPLVELNTLGPMYCVRALYSSEILASLLDAGADPNARLEDGRSLLHEACSRGLLPAVELLVHRAGDVAAYRHNGQSYLDITRSSSHRHIVRFLLQTSFSTSALKTRDVFWLPDTALEAAYTLLWCGFGAAKPLAYTQVELAYMNALCHALNQPHRLASAPHDLLTEELALLQTHCVTPLGFVPNTAYGVSHCDDVDVAAIASALAPLLAAAPHDAARHVHDVLDPNMYCVVANHTHFSVSPHDGRASAAQHVASCASPASRHVSATHQWLPTPMAYDKVSGAARFEAYVNNVNSVDLVASLEGVVARMVPLLRYAQKAANPTAYPSPRVQDLSLPYDTKALLRQLYRVQHNLGPRDVITKAQQRAFRDELAANNVDFDPFWPEVPPVLPEHVHEGCLQNEFAPLLERDNDEDSRLLVVCQVQSYAVSPEAPTHPGQHLWQLGSGLANDAIVATGMLVVASENISLPTIECQQTFGRTNVRMTGDGREVFCPERHALQTQTTGFVHLHPRRLVVVPSAVQHRLLPFHAQDAMQTGQLTLLRVYFVHSDVDVLSTAYVFPQQRALFLDALKGTRLAKVPDSLLRVIEAFVGLAFLDAATADAIAVCAKAERDESLAHTTHIDFDE